MKRCHSKYFAAVKNQRGVTAIVVGMSLFMLVGFSALAVDVGHLYVVKNELQNAADAAALAGANKLYSDDGTYIDSNAINIAYATAVENKSGGQAVEVDKDTDIQIGHFRFADDTFYPVAQYVVKMLWGVSAEDIDDDLEFINAVKVTTHRTQAPSFFARIFGYQSFSVSADSVAYIGFAGELKPRTVDFPMAVCSQSLLDSSGDFTCATGYRVPAAGTAGWTTFVQVEPGESCPGAASASAILALINSSMCEGGNPNPLKLGNLTQSTNGEVESAYKALRSCWMNATDGGIRPWAITLPVIDCSNGIGPCNPMTGLVEVNVMWMTGIGEPDVPPRIDEAPTQMEGLKSDGKYYYDPWSSSDPDGRERWKSFATHFNLKEGPDQNLPLAPYEKASIYFLPDCEMHKPEGRTGGKYYGILAKIPVLVQ